MKLSIIIVLSFVLSSCASYSKYGTSIVSDIGHGFYDSLEIVTWVPDNINCFGMAINKPYFGEKWVSSVGLQIKNEAKTKMRSVELRTENDSDGEVHFIAREWVEVGPKKSALWMRKGIRLGHIFEFEIVVDGDTMYVKEKLGPVHKIELGFDPVSMEIVTSSAKTIAGFYRGKCI